MPDPTETEPQGLDAILSSALDEHYVEDAPVTPVSPEPVEPSSPDAGSDGRPRDDLGRFAPKEAPPSPDGLRRASKPSDKDSQTAAQVQPDPATRPIEPPRNFTAEDKATFARLQREDQEWIARREASREATFTRQSQEAAQLRRTAEPILQAIAPFHGYLSQIAPLTGKTPDQMINGILAAEYQLRTGNPQQKAMAFAQLAQAYGVDLGAIPAGGQVPQGPMATYQPPPQPRPEHQALNNLNQRLEAFERERQGQFDRSISDQITSFQNAKDDQGRPRYPHFERLRSQMALSLAANEVSTLEEAYAKALGPWKEVLDAQQTTQHNASAVEKAKKAVPVRGSAGLPNGANQSKGLDALISKAMESAGFQ
jgi:hypothetical protein